MEPKKTIKISIPLDNEEKSQTKKLDIKKKKQKNELLELIPQEPLPKFHLPILKLNNPENWPSLPLEERKHFTNEVATQTCLENCCGIDGLKSACCTLDPINLEHVLGAVTGVDEKWINDIAVHFRARGLNMSRTDIVIDFEEGKELGKAFFNNHPVFLDKGSYPMLRIQAYGPRFICKFLNPNSGKCTIYANRPQFCRDYTCQYIKANFLVRNSNKPNTYVKLR